MEASERRHPLSRCLGSQTSADLFCRRAGNRPDSRLALGSLDTPISFYFFYTLFHLQITRSGIWNLCCSSRQYCTHLRSINHPRKRKCDRGICALISGTLLLAVPQCMEKRFSSPLFVLDRGIGRARL